MARHDQDKATGTSSGWVRLRNKRKSMGLSQIEAAKRIGVLQSSFSKWESLKKAPSRRRVSQIAVVFELDISEIEADIQREFYSHKIQITP